MRLPTRIRAVMLAVSQWANGDWGLAFKYGPDFDGTGGVIYS